ncbi:MAG: hypothetical protein K0S61_722 [Anaerocolumna sp.]|jgi:hypothetical protein|nr:hypothetical protein [Anaerocolumna sp.]
MIRYYELIGQRMVCQLNFKKGFIPTNEYVSNYMKCEVREISKKEFFELSEKFTNEE